ncbi:MAG: V-type ATP synthase subunit I, partial [Candidatus Methanofastidiosia archaeon]
MTIGLIQMLLAYFFGIINLSKHGIRKAIFEKLGWVLVMVLVYYVFFAYMIEFLPQLPLSMKNTGIILGVVILIALYLIFKYEGGIYLIEVFTLISNLFSYTRLLAIGLSSAGIALATNTMVEVALKSAFSGGIVKTIIMIILALIILIVFHIINLALGIIGPGIHSLRLQYVE